MLVGRKMSWKLSQTSQELRMLSSVTINCQVTKIVMNSGSQLSELSVSVSQMSLVSRIVFFIVKIILNGKSNCLNCQNCRQLS